MIGWYGHQWRVRTGDTFTLFYDEENYEAFMRKPLTPPRELL